MERLCSTCKYFDPYNESEDRMPDEGRNDNVGYCKKSKHITQYEQIPKIEDKNIMISASEWGDCSTVLVGINFSCIHWERLYTGPSQEPVIDRENPYDKEKYKKFVDSLVREIEMKKKNIKPDKQDG